MAEISWKQHFYQRNYWMVDLTKFLFVESKFFFYFKDKFSWKKQWIIRVKRFHEIFSNKRGVYASEIQKCAKYEFQTNGWTTNDWRTVCRLRKFSLMRAHTFLRKFREKNTFTIELLENWELISRNIFWRERISRFLQCFVILQW